MSGRSPEPRDEQTQVPEPVKKCDHICLLDDGHVERGEHHFYGYELPSPRMSGRSDPPPMSDEELDGLVADLHAGFAAHRRTDLLALVAEVRRLRRGLEAVQEIPCGIPGHAVAVGCQRALAAQAVLGGWKAELWRGT